MTSNAGNARNVSMKREHGKMLWQIKIDEKLHRQFKVRCVQLGKSMNDQIAELIRAWLRKAS